MGRKARLAMLAGLGVGVGSALMKRRDQLMRLVRGDSSDWERDDHVVSAGNDTVSTTPDSGADVVSVDETPESESAQEAEVESGQGDAQATPAADSSPGGEDAGDDSVDRSRDE